MTSNTTPSPNVVSYSSRYNDSNYDAWKGFDGLSATCWFTIFGTVPGWLEYDFGAGNEKTIIKYTSWLVS